MKQNKRRMIPIMALIVFVLGAGAALATSGDESDPLITLSYLNKVALPQVIEQVETNIAPVQQSMEENLADQVATYRAEMESIVSAGATDSATFVLVTMTKGQTLTLDLGSEVLLRVGTATVNCGENPALIDISNAGTLNKGSSLTKNHLYMANMTDRVLTATADTVKILVRGGYTLV